ncbi:unnamed protein product [Acanthoscelides obtectus]|uniref:Endonuclease/exonuclease/phosphatase domain-containing protein n=1 Tax=Acanthoscelides obtectus TaxID=200917 RepID=A0A9P0LUM8_ACAOB|nr:unnamed protein product [Acanthoscelides obtectus]CAK1629923.1 RNA-directed DNA polymerase from mobile element jockey [Acanthoscelides obtectus]
MFLSKNDIDVALVSETWFKPNDTIRYHGYNIVRRDRIDGKAGVAIFVKKGIKFCEISFSNNFNDDILVCGINLINQTFDLTLLSIYRPPNINSTAGDWDTIFSNTSISSIIGGDFNAHSHLWGSSFNNSIGYQLINICESKNLVVMNDGSPTRLVAPNQQVTAPDVTICSRDIAQISHWQLTSDTLGSDHFPILMFIPLSFQVYDTIYPKYKWNMKKANWCLYHDLLEDIFDSTPEFYSTQSKYDYLIEKINDVSEISIPILRPFKAKKRPPPPWWDEQCISAIAQRTSALATYKQDSSLANFVHCKKVFAETKKLFKQKSKNSWKAWISKLNKNTSSTDLWKQAKIIRRIPMGKKASTNSDWADDFHRKCSPSFVAAEVVPPPRLHQDNFFSRPFNMTELNLAVKNTRNTSPGCDDITYPMLVNLPSNAKLFLLDIFNNIWLNADTISQWKNIVIVPILKPNMDPNCADSYRPISLLSCVMKT